jgi:hypothetical protein
MIRFGMYGSDLAVTSPAVAAGTTVGSITDYGSTVGTDAIDFFVSTRLEERTGDFESGVQYDRAVLYLRYTR